LQNGNRNACATLFESLCTTTEYPDLGTNTAHRTPCPLHTHCLLHTLRFTTTTAQCRMHFLGTPQYALRTLRTLTMAHCALCILQIAHCTLQTTSCALCGVQSGYCELRIVHTVHCTSCQLRVQHCARCTVHSANCTPHTR
jgi:hypothetical protein